MKTLILSSLALLFCGYTVLRAQPFNDEKAEYRVVAVSGTSDTLISASNSIELGNPLAMEIPSAFTPNGDGLNDTFGAVAKGVTEYKMVIYDRHGALVFQSNNIDIRWNGTSNGEKVPSGGYMYQIYADSYDSGSVTRHGKVMVIH